MKKSISIPLIVSGLLLGLYLYAPYFVVEIKNPLIELVRESNIPKNIELTPVQEKVSLTHNGLTFSGVLTKSTTDTTKATILLIHGIRGNKGWWQTKSLVLADSSYQTLAIDLRAHGESEGRFTTFGAKEKEDVKAWVSWLIKKYPDNKIGIWGQSLGGAVVLQTLAVDERLEFGIIESTFSQFENVAADYGKHYLGFEIKPLTKNIVNRATKLANFNAENANPKQACEHITQPVLFIHGDKDTNINIKYNKENFATVPHSNKTFYTVKGADHYNVWNTGGKAYRETIIEFIDNVR